MGSECVGKAKRTEGKEAESYGFRSLQGLAVEEAGIDNRFSLTAWFASLLAVVTLAPCDIW